jgi:hypothetical protein
VLIIKCCDGQANHKRRSPMKILQFLQ